MSADQQFYVGQKALIKKGNEILVLHDPRLPELTSIDLPGGKIQIGETDFSKALLREIFEETGLDVHINKPFATSYFDVPIGSHPNAGMKIFVVVYECIYRSGTVSLSEEHDWYKWVTEESFGDVFRSETNLYHIIQAYFKERS